MENTTTCSACNQYVEGDVIGCTGALELSGGNPFECCTV